MPILSNDIIEAAQNIKQGKIVLFPTETVYGVGCNPFNSKAIEKIYQTKGRSFDKPLQILIGSLEQVELFAKDISETAKKLMQNHWPGPLTLVFNKKENVLDTLTAGLQSVGLRFPDHPTILELIKHTGPIAATSANISGQPAPKTLEEAKAQIGDKVDFILQGDETRLGQASTVINVTQDPPKVLREGPIKA
jgi:L-threonylcarbamoyladenylate synthase